MTTTRNATWLGMNWIRQEKRLAIYLRDGMSCAWCGKGVEDGVALTLDHVKPHSKGGTNHESNLVTCCAFCNSSRGNRGQIVFARVTAAYINHGATAEAILARVKSFTRRSLTPFLAEAKELVARRGSAAAVIATLK